MATWLQQFGDWNTNLNAGIFGGKNTAGVMQQASGFGKAMGSLGIDAGNIGGIANTIGQLGTGLLAGQNQTSVGNALQTIGGLASNIPGVGGLIGAGVGVLGGLVNAAFGSHINEEFVNQTQMQANAVGNRAFNANTNADVLNDWGNYTEQSLVNQSDVGSDGWFSSKASDKRKELNQQIQEANRRQLANFNAAVENADKNTDFRIMQNMAAYGSPIGSFRRFYANGGSLFDTPEFFTFEPQTYDKGGYLNQAKALIRENEGWSAKPYADSPKGKNWRSVGYGFNDSGFRDKYPEGISKHYEHGITKKQAEEELDYFLKKAEKTLKGIYGKQWDDFSDSQKAAILDTYYQRPASVGKSSRFYKAVTAGEDAGRYLGVAGYSKRNNIRQSVFGGAGFSGGAYEDDSESLSYPSPILEATSPITELDLSGIEPTKVINPEINLSYPSLDLNFLTSSQKPVQQQVPTVGTVEDFLASYGDFEQNLFAHGGRLGKYFDGEGEEPNSLKVERSPHVDLAVNNPWLYNKLHPKKKKKEKYEPTTFAGRIAQVAGASELGQKYTDYTSSVVQQVPVVGLGVSALDLGYDTNRLYHNPSLGATKDVALDAASLLPTLRKTLKGWWMKGNSGSFITEGGQVINNPRLASSLEVMLQPYRTAINTGVYAGRAADFIDDSKAYLQEMWNSNPIGKWANSHDEGGHLAKPTLTNSKVDFSNQLNPLQQKGNVFDGGGWMDFFNSWNQAQGGNNYFGNNWKPSDGLQRNTSNGNAGDWLGVASSVVNTIGNWGKEDPSLGRGGGYSTFGMAAYGVMKAIRDATRSRKEPMDKKLGIPIYCQGGRLFAEGGSVGAMGYAQIGTSALKLASNVKHQASLDDDIDEGKIHRSIDRFGMGLDEAVANVNTNGDLLDLWKDNVTVTPNLGMRDFRDKSLFDDFLDSYAASWEGFNAGQNFGPWGAAIGAIVGGGSSVIGSIIGRNKASNAADEANAKIERANERRFNNLLAAADRVDQENDFRILQNMGANGGKLSMGFGLKNPFVMPDGIATPLYRAFGGGLTHGADFDTGINWVDEGGSHGQNPLGGVPMGVDESGVPNLVEEDEAIWDGDYVFSRRMKVPKKLREKYNLSDDATFADAVKKLTKESEERPLDIISRNTQDHILGELADSQEEMRMAKAQRKMEKEQQLQDDFLTGVQFGLGGHMTPMGLVPNEDNTSFFELLNKQFAEGGGIHIDPSKRGTFKAQASKMGMGVQEAASHILANKENYSPAMVKKANFARNASHWHEDGGSLFENPFGEVNTFDDGGYMWDLFWQKTNASSKKKGNSKSKYRIDDSYTGDIKALEDSEQYKAFTNYILNEASNEERLKYFRWIDDNTGRERTYTNKKGELLDGWQEKFKAARNDGLYGIQHYTPVKNAGTTGTTSLTDLFGTTPVDTSLPEQGLLVFDPKIMGNPEAMAAGTRSTTTDPNGTKVTRVTGDGTSDSGLQRSPFKPKQTWTRYAPIAMNALFGLKEMLTPADYGNADAIMAAAYQAGSPVSVGTEYIGDYRKRDPFDERYLMNMINQNAAATNRNLMNLSGGNRAVAQAGILSNDLTRQMSLAEAARQAYLANRADDADVAAFNKDTNKFNAQAQNTRNLTLAQLNSQRQNAMLSGIAQGARLRQAIKDQRDAAIYANLSNFAQGLGDLGKENASYNMIGGMNKEGFLKYMFGDNWEVMFNNLQAMADKDNSNSNIGG